MEDHQIIDPISVHLYFFVDARLHVLHLPLLIMLLLSFKITVNHI